MDPMQAGEAHGKTLPFRWDTSTAAGVLTLAALAYLVIVSRTFQASGSARISRS